MITNGNVGSVHGNTKTYIRGFDKVLNTLNKEIRNIELKSFAGLIESAILIRRDMDKTEPTIPVDTGTLRSSWTTSGFTTGKGKGLIIGFTANYALWVHEMLDKKGTMATKGKAAKRKKIINWTRPGSGPKFFEYALKRNVEEILKTIRKNVKIPD